MHRHSSKIRIDSADAHAADVSQGQRLGQTAHGIIALVTPVSLQIIWLTAWGEELIF